MKSVFKWVAFVICLCVATAMLAKYFLWTRSFKGEVTCAGQPVQSARVYTDFEGDVLVRFASPNPDAEVVSIRSGRLGVPMEGFWLKTGLVIGLRQDSIRWLDGPGFVGQKSGVQIAGSSADFYDFRNRPVHVTW